MFRVMMRMMGPVLEFDDKSAAEDFVKGFSLGESWDIAMVQQNAAGIIYIDGAAMGVCVQDLTVQDLR